MKPSKFKLRLPIKQIIPSREVKRYYEAEFGDDWPLSSCGNYEKFEMSNVYFFMFKTATGCSYTDSENHSKLPLPDDKQESFTLPQSSANTGAREFFDFNGKAIVCLGNGTFSINDRLGTTDSRNESERTRDAISGIQNWLMRSNHNVTVSAYARNTKKYCPFTGGGDIFFQGDVTSSTFFVHGAADEEEEEESEEALCSVIENKAAPHINDVLLQLQANMVLASVESLCNKIHMSDVTLDQLNDVATITSYGISYGQNVVFQLLRSTFNFQMRELSFDFLLGPKYWLSAVMYVDAAIEYIVSEMTRNNRQ